MGAFRRMMVAFVELARQLKAGRKALENDLVDARPPKGDN